MDGEAQPQGGSLAREGQTQGTCSELHTSAGGKDWLVGPGWGWGQPRNQEGIQEAKAWKTQQGPEDEACAARCIPFYLLTGGNLATPCISQPPLQILMAPQQMECGKKRLGGASGEDLFPRMAELALPFPPSPCLEADVTAGPDTAIL